jgi:hypothetical protein
LPTAIRSPHAILRLGANPVGRFVLPIFLCALAGCAILPILNQPRTSMKLRFDDDGMREEVLRYLSAGMPIENAKRIMEDSGFKCENSLLAGSACLHCSTIYRTHLITSDEIDVCLSHESGKVTAIRVDCHSIGP